MQIKQKIKNTLSKETLKGKLTGAFNIMSGKKGPTAAFCGYLGAGMAGIAAVGTLAAAPVVVAAALGSVVVCAVNAHSAAKDYDKANGPKI